MSYVARSFVYVGVRPSQKGPLAKAFVSLDSLTSAIAAAKKSPEEEPSALDVMRRVNLVLFSKLFLPSAVIGGVYEFSFNPTTQNYSAKVNFAGASEIPQTLKDYWVSTDDAEKLYSEGRKKATETRKALLEEFDDLRKRYQRLPTAGQRRAFLALLIERITTP